MSQFLVTEEEARNQKRFDRRMLGVVVVSILCAVLFVVPYGLRHSQLASPKDGPVRFIWQKDGVNVCEVHAPNQAPRNCSTFTTKKEKRELNKMPLLHEAPPSLDPLFEIPPRI